MKVLITGGAGFIGSSIADELLKKKIEVVIVDNLITGKERNVPREAVLYKADIRDNLDEIFMVEQPDYVIHQAAQVSVSSSISDPVYDGDENIIGTINLLKTCVRYKAKKIIFASTAALYGNPQFLPVDETHPVAPISPYGLSKHCAELYIQLFSSLYGLPYTILRYANVYGIRQDANGEAGVVAIFIEKLLSGEGLKVYGDGLQTRDFIFVKDVARANVAALTRGDNETINISSQSRISIQHIIGELSAFQDISISPVYLDERQGDIRHSILSNDKAKRILNWSPEHTFSAGLRETVVYCESEHLNIK